MEDKDQLSKARLLRYCGESQAAQGRPYCFWLAGGELLYFTSEGQVSLRIP